MNNYLDGFNLILSPIGQEYLWQQVWKQMGLNATDIDDHFTGPAFLTWLIIDIILYS
jgi:alpha-N-acetylglucosaminidase